MTPLLLLDVDGVLNAFGDGVPGTAVWPRWQRGDAEADGTSWPIAFAPDVVERLRGWHEQELVEIQWLTTWGHDANGGLRVLLGLPELKVAGTYDEAGERDGASTDTSAVAHAAAAPAAPDPLSGRWWKYDVVRRVLDEHPDRLVVWVDDELHGRSAFRSWAEQHPRLVPVGPDPRTGLTPEDLERIGGLLTDVRRHV